MKRLLILPDGLLGIGMGFPGKMVTLRLDGTPVDTRYPIGEPAEGKIGVMISIQGSDGVLVASGGRIAFVADGQSHALRFLAVTDYQADDITRILEKITPIDPTGQRFVEADDYYVDQSWTLGPQGNIYAPMRRESHEISVGCWSRSRATDSTGDGDEDATDGGGEAEPLEVICYRMQ